MVVCLLSNKHRTVAFVWGTVGIRDSTLLPRAVPDTAESKHTGNNTWVSKIKIVEIIPRWEKRAVLT